MKCFCDCGDQTTIVIEAVGGAWDKIGRGPFVSSSPLHSMPEASKVTEGKEREELKAFHSWKKIGDGIVEDGDAAMDPVSFHNARLQVQVQTKPLLLKVQTKPYKLNSDIYHLISEEVGYCSTMTELEIATSLNSHFRSDRALTSAMK